MRSHNRYVAKLLGLFRPAVKSDYPASWHNEELARLTIKTKSGKVYVYAQGATAAMMVQENWDESVPLDVVNFLHKLIPPGVWLHDAQDSNGDSHLKAGLVGPSVTIPIIDGQLGLSQWQNIFFCEFDGPRAERRVVCTLIRDLDDGI